MAGDRRISLESFIHYSGKYYSNHRIPDHYERKNAGGCPCGIAKMRRKNVFARLLRLVACVMMLFALTCVVYATAEEGLVMQVELDTETEAAVAAKVQQIADECRKSVDTDDQYAVALWLHDWLTMNAKYDESLKIHGPDGVLLQQTGVCESYTLAYQLLLNEFSIENQLVPSNEMNHIWNLVKIDEVWCHVDCTWDDPTVAEAGIVSGAENHNYFGLTDALMGRDHTWENPEMYPAATDTKNVYIVRQKKDIVTDAESLIAYLNRAAEAKTENIEVYYLGTDNTVDIQTLFREWLDQNMIRYGFNTYSYGGNPYMLIAEITYIDSWEEPKPLETPVDADPFVFLGPNGTYSSEQYSENALVLLFGNSGTMDNLLQKLSGETAASLRSAGVEILVSLLDGTDDLLLAKVLESSGIAAAYPDMKFVCSDGNTMWGNLRKVGYTNNTVNLPAAFVYNNEGQITYYSTGNIRDITALTDAANAVATGNSVLPEPAAATNPLSKPAEGIGFILSGTDGEHKYDDYAEDGLMLIYGRTGESYTQQLLSRLNDYKKLLLAAGVDVIVNLQNCATAEELTASGLETQYPWMKFTFMTDESWRDHFQQVGFSGEAYYPFVFVYNSKKQISYYTTGQVQSMRMLMEEAEAVGTIDITDAGTLIKRLQDGEVLPADRYDFDGDNEVTMADAVYLFRYAVLPELYPIV